MPIADKDSMELDTIREIPCEICVKTDEDISLENKENIEVQKVIQDEEINDNPTRDCSTDYKIPCTVKSCKIKEFITFLCDVTNCGRFFNNENELRVNILFNFRFINVYMQV